MELQETYEVSGPQLDVLGRVETKLPAPLKKPAPAWAVAVLCVVIALFGLGGIKLAGTRGSVETLYAGPSVNDMGVPTEGIAVNLGYRQDAAANIIRIGGRTLGEADPAVTAAQAALDATEKTEGPAEAYAADAALEAAIANLYNACNGKAGGEETGLQGQWSEFQSQKAIIGHDSYNEKAQEFNKSISGFPANLIAAISGGKAELFA